MTSISYVYGRVVAGRRTRLLYHLLGDALYTALHDLHDQRATPLGIRQGRRVLYRPEVLARLHQQYRARLGANDHPAVCVALHAAFDAAPSLQGVGALTEAGVPGTDCAR